MDNEQILEKQRHGCVTSLLILLIIGNSVSVIFNFYNPEFIDTSLAVKLSDSEKIIFSFFQIANLISCVLLFQWKKMGFWLYVLTDGAFVGFNIYQGNGLSTLWSAIVGITLLYGVMQIETKTQKTTWDELI